MAKSLPRRSRRANRRGSLRPRRQPPPAPHAGQTLTAPCFRLWSRPTENCFVCFRTGAVRQQKKWGPQRDPRKFRAGIGGKLSSSDAPQGTPSSDKGLLHALQGLAAVLGPVEVGEQFRGAAVVVGGGHLEAHARAAVAAAHVGAGLRRIEDAVALVVFEGGREAGLTRQEARGELPLAPG